jgi:hypothetical protein
MSFAECALLEDEKELLFIQNNEAKRRQSTKSTIVGKAKVLSYEDIKEAKKKRTANDQASASKKRKVPTGGGAGEKSGQKSEVEIAQDEIAAGGMGKYCSFLQF